MIALAGVVVNDVEDYFQASFVETIDGGADLRQVAMWFQVAGCWRKKTQCAVAPVVAQTFLYQVAVVIEGMKSASIRWR